MANQKVRLHLRGINEVLRKAQPLVDEVGESITSGASGNYCYVKNPHPFTARGHVEPADSATAKADTETNELLRSFGRNIR